MAPPPPPQFHYQQPYFTTPSHPPPRRTFTPYLITFARQFTLLIPGIVLILNIWWAATSRVCPPSAPASDVCFWLLWLTLPIATVSFIWGIVEIISARRANHRMSHIPRSVDVCVRGVLAVGATVCFALLVYHMVRWDIWGAGAEAAMIALLAILMVVQWVLFVWAAYDLKRTRQEQRYYNNHIGI